MITEEEYIEAQKVITEWNYQKIQENYIKAQTNLDNRLAEIKKSIEGGSI